MNYNRKYKSSPLLSALCRLTAVALAALALRFTADSGSALVLSRRLLTSDLPAHIVRSALTPVVLDEENAAAFLLRLTLFPLQPTEKASPRADEADPSEAVSDYPPPQDDADSITSSRKPAVPPNQPPELPEATLPSSPVLPPAEIHSGEYAWEDILLRNNTDYEIDIEKLIGEPLPFSVDSPLRVLILHTHTTEAYAGDDYLPTEPYRTLDESHSVVRVGDELERVLTEKGISVIHDKTLNDYPNYNSSYKNAWQVIEGRIKDDPGIQIVIDLHRDALEGSDGTVYKTVADVGDEPCAQIELIVGTDFRGLVHPDWRKNLSFALKLESEMNTMYPTLARPLAISQYRYNQHATAGSLIVEVGCNGNTLDEALNAVRLFGNCMVSVLEKG